MANALLAGTGQSQRPWLNIKLSPMSRPVTSGTEARKTRVDLSLIAVMLAGVSTFLDVYTTQPLLPFLQRVFGASVRGVSLTVSATTFGIAIAAPLVGLIGEVAGRKRVIVPAIFGLSLPTMLAATSHSLRALVLWRFCQGFFIPGIIAVMLAYIGEEWAERGVGTAMSAYIAGTVVGGFTGRFISGVIAAHWSWQAPFVILGALNLISGLLVRSWLPPSTVFVRGRAVGEIVREGLGHLRNSRLLANYGMGFSLLFSLVGAFTYVNFYLAAPPFRMNSAQLGMVFFVYLFGAVVTPLGGKLLDRSGFQATAIVALVLSLLGLALTLNKMLWLVIIGLALYCTGLFISQAAATVQTGRIAGRARSSAAGLYVTLYYLGGSLGALVPAWFWSHGGWIACVGVFSVSSVATLAFGLLSAR
jgi:MFS transporter, YNFM family, putative membrane transport protein